MLRIHFAKKKKRSEMAELKAKLSLFEMQNAIKDATITKKSSDIEAKIEALKEKDAIISGINEQLTRTREYLASEQQVSVLTLHIALYTKYTRN